MTGPWARFDDLRSGTSLLFPGARQVLAAEREDDVVPVLAAVERATAQGAWAFGYVAYEAAPGLDPSLRVADRRPGSPPLVWFGLTGRPSPAPPLQPADPAPDSDPAAEHDELTAKAAVLTVRSATSR